MNQYVGIIFGIMKMEPLVSAKNWVEPEVSLVENILNYLLMEYLLGHVKVHCFFPIVPMVRQHVQEVKKLELKLHVLAYLKFKFNLLYVVLVAPHLPYN